MKRLGLLLLFVGCGYEPIYASGAAQKVCVRAAAPKIAEFAAIEAALEGARRELAKADALSSSDHGPCLVVELTRVQEVPAGIRADPVGDREQPRAAGSEMRVTGRGWIEPTRGGVVSRDTGDIVRTSRGGAGTSDVNDAINYRSLVRAAAEDLGRAIAQRVLGLPTVSR